jgi:hypothetical protein
VELLPGGADIQVTSENIHEYCLGVAKYHLVTSVREEIRSFLEGFHSVIPSRIVSIFDQDELDFLLEGTQEIDLADWKTNTIYRGDFTNKHKVVKWFWEILETYSQKELRKLLLFATGMPRVPIDGFRALQSNRGRTCKF